MNKELKSWLGEDSGIVLMPWIRYKDIFSWDSTQDRRLTMTMGGRRRSERLKKSVRLGGGAKQPKDRRTPKPRTHDSVGGPAIPCSCLDEWPVIGLHADVHVWSGCHSTSPSPAVTLSFRWCSRFSATHIAFCQSLNECPWSIWFGSCRAHVTRWTFVAETSCHADSLGVHTCKI